MTVLAIDQGTTSTRAMLFADGVLRPVFQRRHRQILPAPGHVEHDPEELLANVAAAAQSGADVVALANQGESCLAWDARDGRPVGPVIVWQDDRTAATMREMHAAGLDAEVMARAGLPLDPYFSASKLGWIVRHVPAAGALAKAGRLRLGTTDAFFRDRLTGRFETDIATASRTSLMNLETGAWDPALCEIFGVPFGALPAITRTAGDLGTLPGGARLGASIVDQQAALFGHGCRNPGDAKATFGTGAFVQCLTAGPVRPDRPGPLPTVAWHLPDEPVAYALDGAVYVAAAAVEWARSLGLFAEYDAIERFEAGPAIDRGLVFLPALAGLACPHWDRTVRGAWVGLSLEHGPSDLMQALLEGIAMRTVEALRSIEALQPVARLSIDGGLTRNAYLVDFLAGLLSQPVVRAGEVETTALGLAHMALAASGAAPPLPARQAALAAGPSDGAERRLGRFARAREAATALARDLSAAG